MSVVLYILLSLCVQIPTRREQQQDQGQRKCTQRPQLLSLWGECFTCPRAVTTYVLKIELSNRKYNINNFWLDNFIVWFTRPRSGWEDNLRGLQDKIWYKTSTTASWSGPPRVFSWYRCLNLKQSAPWWYHSILVSYQTGTPQKAIKTKRRTKVSLSGTIGKRFVFQIKSQTSNP